MATGSPPDNRTVPPASRFARPTPASNRRLAFRLLGLPMLAFAGIYLYYGLRPYVVLPQCDSDTAKQSLSEVLKQLKLEPTRYEPITTVSSSKEEVVCNAVMPLPDGGSVTVDYTFYWQGTKANMKYSIGHKAS